MKQLSILLYSPWMHLSSLKCNTWDSVPGCCRDMSDMSFPVYVQTVVFVCTSGSLHQSIWLSYNWKAMSPSEALLYAANPFCICHSGSSWVTAGTCRKSQWPLKQKRLSFHSTHLTAMGARRSAHALAALACGPAAPKSHSSHTSATTGFSKPLGKETLPRSNWPGTSWQAERWEGHFFSFFCQWLLKTTTSNRTGHKEDLHN